MQPLLMVSDDELMLARALVRKAKTAGMRAFSDTTSRAFELAQRYRPDLILLDLAQRVDGKQLLSELKSHVDTRDIPVVIITGVGSAALRGGFLALGAADYVLKPFGSDFFSRISRHLKAGVGSLEAAFDEPEAQAVPVQGRVLLVESGGTWAKVAARLSLTHQVDRVETLEQARLAVHSQRYHVVCTDLPGSGAEGVQLVQWARTHDPVLRGVLLGDSAQYAVAARLDRDCCCTVLLKPHSLERLTEEVDRAVRLARSMAASGVQRGHSSSENTEP